MKAIVPGLQRIGRALMLPIAVLPVAGLLLRLGQPDLLDLPAVAAAGNAIFANLGILFAIGVAVGLARENHGAAGLASVVAYFVATKGAEVLIDVPAEAVAQFTGAARELGIAAYRASELSKLSVPAGILSGLIAGVLYNRYHNIRLPEYLAFFGGRRFVPIASGVAGLVLALCFGYGWPILEAGMDNASRGILGSGSVGIFLYGLLNRVLIITGLHHILNNLAWFLLGDFNNATGDLRRFFAGDPTAGAFMSGFFPVMMFGLPAACLAMYRTIPLERRKAAGGLLFSIALTSFLTGVTEPIEFTFMFLAPVLYAVHAVLTGLSMVLMDALGVRLGFGFSAGLFDYVLNYGLATRPLWLLPIGAVYFAVYYGLFRFFIVRFNLKTPGRDVEPIATADVQPLTADNRLDEWIAALGGRENLESVDACTTRLRLVVADQRVIAEDRLKLLGARGLVRPGANALQVVVGPVADQLAGDIRDRLKLAHQRSTSVVTASSTSATYISCDALLLALGGADNVKSIDANATRVRVNVNRLDAVDESSMRAAGVREIGRLSNEVLHLIVGRDAPAVRDALRSAMLAR